MRKDKEYIHKFFPIEAHETGAIQEYLEGMAQQGLFFHKRKGAFWFFQEGTPKKIYYYVDIFDGASWFDSRAEEETLNYKEFCEENGWTYIYTEGKYQYFCSENEHAVPIETDQKRKLRTLYKASALSKIILPIIWIGICLLNLFSIYIKHHGDIFAGIIEMSYLSMSTFVLWIGIGIESLYSLISHLIYYYSNKNRIRNGYEINTHSLKTVNRNYKIKLTVLGSTIVIYLALLYQKYPVLSIGEVIIYTLLIVIGFASTIYLKDKRKLRSRNYNQIKTIGMVVGGCAVMIVLLNLVVVLVLSTSYFQNLHHKKCVDKNGNIVFYTYEGVKLPYTLEDAGYKTSENGYQESYIDRDKGFFCTTVKYSSTDYIKGQEDITSAIYYEKYEFQNHFFCNEWVKAYSKQAKTRHFNEGKLSKKWGAHAAYLIDKKKVLLVFHKKCYILSDNLKNALVLKTILN